MFSQASRKASKPQLTSVARAPRRHRRSTLPRPDTSWFRRALASLTVVALVSGFGLVAAAPSSAAGPAQNYIVVLKDSVVDAGAAALAQQSAYGFTASKVYRNAVNGYSATLTASQAQRIQADPNVDFVTAGRTFQQPPDLAVRGRPGDTVLAGADRRNGLQRPEGPRQGAGSDQCQRRRDRQRHRCHPPGPERQGRRRLPVRLAR